MLQDELYTKEEIFAGKPLHGPRIKKYIFTEKDFLCVKMGQEITKLLLKNLYMGQESKKLYTQRKKKIGLKTFTWIKIKTSL